MKNERDKLRRVEGRFSGSSNQLNVLNFHWKNGVQNPLCFEMVAVGPNCARRSKVGGRVFLVRRNIFYSPPDGEDFPQHVEGGIFHLRNVKAAHLSKKWGEEQSSPFWVSGVSIHTIRQTCKHLLAKRMESFLLAQP